MRVLVTGGTGFLGSALIDQLRRSGHVVTGFSRRRSSNGIVGDITDPTSISSAIKEFQPEIVYNLASQTDLANLPAGATYQANTNGVLNLIRAVADSNSIKRVVWLSSQLVNRPGKVPASDNDYDPVGEYGASKMEGEIIVRENDGGGKEWAIVRPTTVWGPGMSPHYQRLLAMIQKGLYFHIGRQPIYKSYSYIDNLTHQLECMSAADVALLHRGTFYAADSQPIELREWCDGFARRLEVSIPTLPKIVARILANVGDAASLVGVTRVPLNSSRLNNILTEYVFDTRPIERICGQSRVSNQEGIRRTADWWLASKSVEISGKSV
ncbi:MAG: NAD(P)-dependent oxidoreductase [Rhizobium sp.]|nr:NAD(P)-dependent oxidoreductase [Rhizobium sp.]MDM8013360.1 NAD(P)-dependent oxidoreductase [Rhizobium sp.]